MASPGRSCKSRRSSGRRRRNLSPLNNLLTCLKIVFSRQESIKQAERERRMKYKKQDDEREVIRSSIREKVI